MSEQLKIGITKTNPMTRETSLPKLPTKIDYLVTIESKAKEKKIKENKRTNTATSNL